MIFLGQFEMILEQERRLQLPSRYAKELRVSTGNKLLGCPMIVTPLDESLSMFPLDYFQSSDVHGWIRDISWTKEISEMVQNNKFHPCVPFYKSDRISEKVREATKILTGEIKRGPETLRNLSGKDAERLLYEILTSLGINVQLNVHILGAEIDLLLLELNEHGRVEFTIIECKHRERSQKVIGINQIMRLYGLKEALKKDLSIKNALIVSTTGFSSNAKQFAKLYKLDLVNYQGFLDWVATHDLVSKSPHYPVFRMVNLDQRGRFYLPECLTSYLKVYDQRITILGLMDRIEIWNTFTFEKYFARSEELFDDSIVPKSFEI